MEPEVPEFVEAPLPDDIANGTPEDILTRVRLIDNELKVSLGSTALCLDWRSA